MSMSLASEKDSMLSVTPSWSLPLTRINHTPPMSVAGATGSHRMSVVTLFQVNVRSDTGVATLGMLNCALAVKLFCGATVMVAPSRGRSSSRPTSVDSQPRRQARLLAASNTRGLRSRAKGRKLSRLTALGRGFIRTFSRAQGDRVVQSLSKACH